MNEGIIMKIKYSPVSHFAEQSGISRYGEVIVVNGAVAFDLSGVPESVVIPISHPDLRCVSRTGGVLTVEAPEYYWGSDRPDETTEDLPDQGVWKGEATLIAPPPVTAEQVRAERDGLLVTHVDPLVTNPLRWGELSVSDQDAVKAYRLALLDVPQQASFPENVDWPVWPLGGA